MTPSDQIHINHAYAHLYEAMNEICQVFEKDNILVHMQNKLYALEDTLHQYVDRPSKGVQK